MKPKNKIIFLLSFLLIPFLGNSQIKEEVLNVGNKNKKPQINTKNIQKKKTNPERYPATEERYPAESKDTLTYNIVDIPVVSDFKTTQLPPQPLNAADFKDKHYDNYVKAAYGTRNTLLADAFVSYPINNNDRIGANFSTFSTDGLSKKQYNWNTSSSHIETEGFYMMNTKSGKLHLAGNYTYTGLNYYGINQPILFASPNMDLKQNINKVTFKSDYDLYSNNYLDNASLKAGYWWDKFNSKESFVDLKAKLAKSENNAFMILSGLAFGVEADVLLNYTDTRFGLSAKDKYSYLTIGFSPVLKISSGLSYLEVGANVMYNGEFNKNDSKFFFYPKAEFLYHNSKELKLFAGVTGGLKLNNISDMMIENPYLYSNQKLLPSNTLYKIYVGLKGDVNEGIKYNAEASYSRAENLLFYARNNFGNTLIAPELLSPYDRLNTFTAVYDDANILNIKGDVHYIWHENLILAADAEYNYYSNLDHLLHAYNKPNFQIGLDGAYKMLDDKLRLQAKVFFTGQRKSNEYYINSDWKQKIITLKSYFDANLSVSYQLLDNFSIFIEGNNLFDRNYERYQNYKVQGLQVLGGILYKF